METTLIISMVTIFLTWLYVQQKRLRDYEWECMAYCRLSQCPSFIEMAKRFTKSMRETNETTLKAAEGFKAFGESIPK